MPRKPHPSSVLKTLPDEDQAALYEFLRDKTLKDGVAWVFSNNGLRTSDSSLSEWRGWYEMRQTITSWNADVEELQRSLADIGTDPDLIPKIGEAVFIARAAKSGDAKTFTAVASVIQRHKELQASQAAHGDKMGLEEKKLTRKDRALDQAEKKLAIAEGKLKAAAQKLEELRDPAKADDKEMRQRILDEVDLAMGIKKS